MLTVHVHNIMVALQQLSDQSLSSIVVTSPHSPAGPLCVKALHIAVAVVTQAQLIVNTLGHMSHYSLYLHTHAHIEESVCVTEREREM